MCDVLFIEMFAGITNKMGLVSPRTVFTIFQSILEEKGFTVEKVPVFLTDNKVVEHLNSKEELINIDLPGILRKESPKIVAFSTLSPQYNKTVKIKNIVRKVVPDTVICVGNLHATAFPEQVLSDGFDYVFLNNGLISFPEFVESVFAGKIPSERIIHQKEFDDLDSLPFYSSNAYKNCMPSEFGQPFGPMTTTLNCPLNCKFCCTQYYGHTWKPMSAERVVDELEYQHKTWGFTLFYFTDPSAIPHLEGVHRFAEINRLLDKKGLHFRFIISSPLNIIASVVKDDPKLLDLAFKRIERVFVGIESISDDVLKNYHKGLTYKNMQIGINALQERNINIMASMILGDFKDTANSMQNTYEFIKDFVRPTILSSTILTPFPCSVFYNELKEQGLLLCEDWEKYDFYHLVFKHPHFTPDELESLNQYYTKDFYGDYYDLAAPFD